MKFRVRVGNDITCRFAFAHSMTWSVWRFGVPKNARNPHVQDALEYCRLQTAMEILPRDWPNGHFRIRSDSDSKDANTEVVFVMLARANGQAFAILGFFLRGRVSSVVLDFAAAHPMHRASRCEVHGWCGMLYSLVQMANSNGVRLFGRRPKFAKFT